ncbi:MAG: LysE family transporter, partial [Flavobacteriaceae bacterium]|nr:LysE family transporter [Flavobacteriaceae bacterium]
MIEFQVLISFSVAVFFLAISPGPDNIFVAFQSLRFGFKSGLFVIMGLMSGCLVHTILGAFGAAVFLARFPFLLIVIKILGAVYLLYLAYS